MSTELKRFAWNIPDLLVNVLSGSTFLDHGHNDVLSRHEWQFLVDALLDDSLVDNNTIGDVVQLLERY